jgi:hypothetical protein
MYLIEVCNSKKHPVSIGSLTEEELNGLNKKIFFFNWKKERKYNLFKLCIAGQEDILGLLSVEFYDAEYRVHVRLLAASKENVGNKKLFQRIAGCLFAYTAMLAIKKYGENAAISLRPKTELGQYYMDEYGFEQAGISLFMEGKTLQQLFKKYMMNNKEYTAALDEFGKKELAANMVFPAKLTAKQHKDAGAVLNDLLARRRAAMNDADKLQAKLLQVRFKMEEYINGSRFDKTKTFGYFLKIYITSLNKKRNEFAHEINIKPTVLSQYINSHREPPKDIFIRLEIHSHKKIPAVSWYRLLEKQTIHTLDTSIALRTRQQKNVIKKASLV